MFRLQMHALWSLDYAEPLTRMLARVCACDLEEAAGMVKALSAQTTLHLEARTPSEASFLARDLLQFGVYVEVEQIGRISEEALLEDALRGMPLSMHGWYVLVDEATGRPLHLIDRHTLVSLRYESIQLSEQVGEEMLRRGAIPIDQERMAELDRVMDKLRPEYERRESEHMATRIQLIKQRRRRGETSWMGGEDEDGSDEED